MRWNIWLYLASNSSSASTNRSTLSMSVGLLLWYIYSCTHKTALQSAFNRDPLQSFKSEVSFRTLLPRFESTLMTLARFPEYSNWMLVLYWLSTSSMTFNAECYVSTGPLRYLQSVLCLPKQTNSHNLSLVFRAYCQHTNHISDLLSWGLVSR